ncbi:hypothetical protein [Mycobacterium sp. DL440]|uniref:hypothetical protein n=1 Tax=Mycobacterium sp. DL440 TaxID=2675523 RepID=UPI0014229112|nr:hypothetical protein [Mycobacterium sp. DL440]
MSLQTGSQVGEPAVDAEHAAKSVVTGPEPASEFNIGNLSRRMRLLLVTCLTVDAAILLWLAVWDATLTRTAWDLSGTALLSGSASHAGWLPRGYSDARRTRFSPRW